MANTCLNHKRRQFLTSLLLLVTADYAAAKVNLTQSWIQETELAEFAQQLQQEFAIPSHWTSSRLKRAKQLRQIKPLMLPSQLPGKKNWLGYQKNALAQTRINRGVAFARQYAPILQQAEQLFQVDAWVILGILGMETNFGSITGNFKTLDVLSTLAFDFPAQHPKKEQRQAYFRNELKALLQLAFQQRIELDSCKGSFAGAIGWPQFMPSSLANYAVDGDNDGKINLFNPVDAIFSIANYLKQFGWQAQLPAYYDITTTAVSAQDWPLLLEQDILPSFSQAQLQQLGVHFKPTELSHHGLLAIVKLENASAAASFIAGSSNFYCITRYNKSSYYAMAVTQLGQKIAAQVKLKPTTKTAS